MTSRSGASAHVILGDTPGAVYPVIATCTLPGDKVLQETFSLRTVNFGNCDGESPPEKRLCLHFEYLQDRYGNLQNAGKVNTSIPLMAKMYLFKEGSVEVDGAIVGSREYSVETNLQDAILMFGEQQGVPDGGGIYTVNYDLGEEAKVLQIPISGSAMVDGELITADELTVHVFGVDMQIEPTVTDPNPAIITLMDADGYTIDDTVIDYQIDPNTYRASTAYVVILKDGKAWAYVASETQGNGSATIPRGFQFDPNGTYQIGVLLNAGTEVQINSRAIDLYPVHVGFIDDFPDYARNENEYEDDVYKDNGDSDNFFLRDKIHGNNDHEDLDIFYRILPKNIPIANVVINVYNGTKQQPFESIIGEKDDSGIFKTGDDLHVKWTPLLPADTDSTDYAGFWRFELEVEIEGLPEHIKTSINDADPNTDGWQCPQDALAIQDLIWKHRLIVNVHSDEIGWPGSTEEFYEESYKEKGGHAKEWLAGQTEPYIHDPGVRPDSTSSFLDLFDDDKATIGDLDSYTIEDREVLTTNNGAATVYHSANRKDSTNFVFLQFWMFENFSRKSFGILGIPANPDVQHEGDMEHCQISVKLRDEHNTTNKSKWLTPFGATASQHYYAQTLKWDMNDGSAAQNAHTQEHVEHIDGRLVVYVALGSHATYFVADDDINVPDKDIYLGTQQQYDPEPKWAYDRTAHAPNQEDPNQEDPMQGYSLVPLHQNEWLADFQGRWGYLLRYNPGSFSNGPAGPPHRSALLPHPILPFVAGDPVHLRDQPRALHNHARKESQEEEMFIPN